MKILQNNFGPCVSNRPPQQSELFIAARIQRRGDENEDERKERYVKKKNKKGKTSDPLWREIDFIWFYFGLFLKNVLKGTVRTVFSKELK